MVKIILNSIGITILTSLTLGCVYVLVGLILNFWNETITGAAVGFMGAILIGTFSLFLLDILIDKQIVCKNTNIL
jgi:hypothetical protein